MSGSTYLLVSSTCSRAGVDTETDPRPLGRFEQDIKPFSTVGSAHMNALLAIR
jgi:hypothetical protein